MTPDELLTLASRLVERAEGDEQIEVACSHGLSTSVRVYDGSVESLTQAEDRTDREANRGGEQRECRHPFDHAV